MVEAPGECEGAESKQDRAQRGEGAVAPKLTRGEEECGRGKQMSR
jgi:hypothetical protein